MGTAVKHPVSDRVKQSFVIFDFRTLWRSGPGCFISVPIWQQWASKCQNDNLCPSMVLGYVAVRPLSVSGVLDDSSVGRCIVLDFAVAVHSWKNTQRWTSATLRERPTASHWYGYRGSSGQGEGPPVRTVAP